jgi:ABC-type lipoprotein release transport system permease subunit
MKTINLYLLEYALGVLKREKFKSLFLVSILSILVALLSSVFFITNSIKYELNATLDALPKIIVQNTRASKLTEIQESIADKLLDLEGVVSVNARIWGYYKFEKAGVYFTLVGVDEFEDSYTQTLSEINKNARLNDSNMLVGEGVLKILQENYYEDYFNFIKPDGSIKRVAIAGSFHTKLNLEANDMIVMKKDLLQEIFAIPQGYASDIVLEVANLKEIPTIAVKIKQLLPNARVITRDDLKLSYENIFNYKGGVFLALFLVSIFTFFIIVYDKLSGLSSTQTKEIGVLKAVGWKVSDLLKEKFYEAFIISATSYLLGVLMALIFVYIFNAPYLSDIFIGYSDLKPDLDIAFVFDFKTLFLVFFLSVPVYIAATIIPAWKVATQDADEIMR